LKGSAPPSSLLPLKGFLFPPPSLPPGLKGTGTIKVKVVDGRGRMWELFPSFPLPFFLSSSFFPSFLPRGFLRAGSEVKVTDHFSLFFLSFSLTIFPLPPSSVKGQIHHARRENSHTNAPSFSFLPPSPEAFSPPFFFLFLL